MAVAPIEGVGTRAVLEGTADFVRGVGDTVEGMLLYPNMALGYITGTDDRLGEGHALFSSQFGQNYRRWNWVEMVEKNPVARTAAVISHMVGGAFDLLLGHAPNHVFNEKLHLNVPYFSPSPITTREWGRDLSMVGVMVATPSVKARVMGKAPKPVVVQSRPVVEQPPLATPMPAFSILPGVVRAARWVSDLFTRSNPFGDYARAFDQAMRGEGEMKYPAVQRLLKHPRLSPAFISDLIKAAKTQPEATLALWHLARARPGLFSAEHIPGLVEMAKTQPGAVGVLSDLARAQPGLFSAEHIHGLVEVAKMREGAAWVLSDLARARPKLTPQILPGLVEVAKMREGAAWVLFYLAQVRPRLFRPTQGKN